MVPEGEWQTRKKRIDPKLKALGWKVVAFKESCTLSDYHNCAVEEYPTANGPADYALVVDGAVLGVIEAKKLTIGPQNVLTQAERYSRGLHSKERGFNGFGAPFLYSTNGEAIWHHDIRHELNRSHRISDFHSPAALSSKFDHDIHAACAKLVDTPNQHPRLREYQREANHDIEKAIADRKRNLLVAMATGTGKTFTTVNQVYRLMDGHAAKRILFLVDRRALAAQAVQAFASFEPKPGLKFDQIFEVYSQRFRKEDLDEDVKFDPKVMPNEYLTNPQPKHSFVYVCTIQRMVINLLGRDAVWHSEEAADDDAEKLNIPIHAFDVVIADECHRGYGAHEESIWKKVLDHFDAIKIGLTATPAQQTVGYFGSPVFRYDYDRAVREGHLVDYDMVAVKSDVRMNGVFLKEGERVGLRDPESGQEKLDNLEDDRQFDAPEVERKVTSPDSNIKIIAELKKYADEHQQAHGRFPKTLIFAANDVHHTSHADEIVNIARDLFGRGDPFVQKITGTVDRPLQRIREFRNRQNPGIVVTVDMLSTGVDVPDIEFIVFLRPVQSRILFEQMLGRGTRKSVNYPDKSRFIVFDCFDGTLFQYFKQSTSMTFDPPQTPTRTVKEIIDDIWNNKDRDYNVRCLVKRLRRIEKEMSGDAREMFAAFFTHGDIGEFAATLPRLLKEGFVSTMNILRDPKFQDLLVNYPRPPKQFLVAHDNVDTVSSQWVIRGADGQEYRPEDYLKAFERYVRENAATIEAIRILLDRPSGWSVETLVELRQKLAAAPQRFTEDQLRQVHNLTYRKALVDIISMVKHAAKETNPLLTASERVTRAIERVTAGLKLTDEQHKWLDRIRAHLEECLTIARDDFDTLPVFEREGGWAKANRVFDGKLDKLIAQLNEAVAA